MFNIAQPKSSLAIRIWSLVASLVLNVAVIGGVLAAAQVSYMRAAADRLLAQMRKELTNYRMVLLLPAANLHKPFQNPSTKPVAKRPAQRKAVQPLAVPDDRLLREMDVRITKFIKENPGIEGIFTREIVRDVDAGDLDLRKLLVKSRLRIRCEVDDAGRIGRRRIEISSRVHSLDHLAMELLRLLEKYGLLTILKGVAGIVVDIRVDEQVSVSLETVLEPTAQPESIRNQIQGMMTLLRLTIPQEEAAFFLKDLSLTAGEHRVILYKGFDKSSLASFMMRYYQRQPN